MKVSRPVLTALAAAALVATLSPSRAAAEAARFEIDPTHFSVVFNADHIGYGGTWGMFMKGEGGFSYDEATRTLTDLTVTLDASSVFTNHDRRDQHLRAEDFLFVEEHPTLSFVMTEAVESSETTGTVTGDLTLRGVTRPVSLDVTLNKIGEYPFGHKQRTIGVKATTVIKRSEWGMTYAVDNGLVGDDVPVTIELEAIRQD